MEEWSITDLDFSIDDFAMEPAYGLLTLITYKTGQYVSLPPLNMSQYLSAAQCQGTPAQTI